MKPRRDQRLTGLVITVAAVGILGGLITLMPSSQPQPVTSVEAPTIADGQTNPNQHAKDARSREIEMRFQQSIAMLHAKQFDYAVKSLHRVLELSPRLVDAHVNMGYALIGLKEYKAAHDFFLSATELRSEQVNAYYGMAVALEGMGDLEGALGAMRTYIHLSAKDDPFIAKARAALWEWQEKVAQQRQQNEKTAAETASSKG
ncbi:MAG: hypothetical protein ABFS08_04000 [Pseudomonadota bacterium]